MARTSEVLHSLILSSLIRHHRSSDLRLRRNLDLSLVSDLAFDALDLGRKASDLPDCRRDRPLVCSEDGSSCGRGSTAAPRKCLEDGRLGGGEVSEVVETEGVEITGELSEAVDGREPTSEILAIAGIFG